MVELAELDDKVLGPKTQVVSFRSHFANLRRGSSPDFPQESLVSIFQMPQPPDDERLTSPDWMYVGHYEALCSEFRSGPLLFPSKLGSNVGIQLHNARFPRTSSVYRCAALVLMSYLNDNTGSVKNFGYLAKYYREAQKCFQGGSILEVVFASYIVAVYSLIGGDKVQLAIHCCIQFCYATVAVTKRRMARDDQLLWFERWLQDILSSLYYVHRDSVLFNRTDSPRALTDSYEQLQGLFDKSSYLLASEEDVSRLPLSMTTQVILHKIRSLSIHMQFYLDCFLFLAVSKADMVKTRDVRDRLYTILNRIIQLIRHLPNIGDYIYHAYSLLPQSDFGSETHDVANAFLGFADVQPCGLILASDAKERDTALALLYAFARLLKNLLESNSESGENATVEIYHSAFALCRLCASFPDRSANTRNFVLLTKRSLFWAGIVLAKSKFQDGEYTYCDISDESSSYLD
jgi:hypothetical protein